MNLQQLNQLERLQKRLNELSALTFVIKGSVENIGRNYEANLDITTADVELVLRTLGYELAGLHEELESLLNAIPMEYKRSLVMQSLQTEPVKAAKVSKRLKIVEEAQA